jgi:hypothetical protein
MRPDQDLHRCLALVLGVIVIVLTSGIAPASESQVRPRRVPLEPASGVADTAPTRVLRVGAVQLRLTNRGSIGALPGEVVQGPTGEWPRNSGIEYLSSIRFAVGAKDPEAFLPELVRRVSASDEWQPRTRESRDQIWLGRDGIGHGYRFNDDDQDGRVDEEILDGRDDDGDGLIDEDCEILGDEMCSFTMRDDTPFAIHPIGAGPQVPIGLTCTVRAWGYRATSASNFVCVDYTVQNDSGHMLDSLFIGWTADLSCGPRTAGAAFALDDVLLPAFPSNSMTLALDANDPRHQFPHDPSVNFFIPVDSSLCPRIAVLTRGFSVADQDGDAGQTPGISSFLLLDHTVDATGFRAPRRVGFRAFRDLSSNPPGSPKTDLDYYGLMTSTEGVDPATGFPNAPANGIAGNPVVFCSIGPFLLFPSQGRVHATIAFAVAPGTCAAASQYPVDRAQYLAGQLGAAALFQKDPALYNAFRLSLIQNGDDIVPPIGARVPNLHGRETALIAPPGTQFERADCRDDSLGQSRLVTDDAFTWFDFDCDFCTGVYDYASQTGLFHRPWIVPPQLVDVAALSPGTRFHLGSPVPNPSAGIVRFDLESDREGVLATSVFDAAGRTVRRFAPRPVSPGHSLVTWDGRDGRGRLVSPGLYLVRAEVNGKSLVRKLLVVH